MPHLHGKGGPQQVCKTCNDECVSWEGIFCAECGNWFHIKCEQVEIQILQAFKEVPEVPYICRSCRTDEKGFFSYPKTSQRLHKAAKRGIEELFMAVERERLLMKENLNYSTPKMPKYVADHLSEQLLNEHFPNEKRRAIKITIDNNSLFSAVSVALCGSEKLATELRVRCCIEMVVYEAFYKWQKNYMLLSACAPEYPESCINCATLNEDSCVWTLSALASVVRRPIRSVYPAVNGKMDRAVEPLNAVFHPRNKVDEGEELKIFWSSSKKIDSLPAGTWIPDIFVPLIDVPAVQLSPMVSPTRISGRMRKPTPKVMAVTTKDKLRVIVHETDSDGGADESDADPSFEAPRDNNQEETDDELFPHPRIKMEHVDFSWMDKYTHAAIEGKPLKGTNFLPAQEIFNELTTAIEVLPSIPTGRKEDLYFIVDNSRNLKFRHRRNYFQDDCGRYNQKSGTTCKSYYLLTPDHRLLPLMKNKDKYCRESKRVSLSGGSAPRGRGRPQGRSRGRPRSEMPKEDRVTQWIPMEPQPDEEKIIMLNRYYSSLELDPTYKRRISWFVNLPNSIQKGRNAFLVEYLTKAPPGIQLPANRKVITNINLVDYEEDGEEADEMEDSQAENDSAYKDQSGIASVREDDLPVASETASSEKMGDIEIVPDVDRQDQDKSLPNSPIREKSQSEEKSCNKEKSPVSEKSSSKDKSGLEDISPNKDSESEKCEAPTEKALATIEAECKTGKPKQSERVRKRTVSSDAEFETGRGKRRKIPSAKAIESGSQTNFDSD